MSEKKEYIKGELLSLADSLCVSDVRSDIERHGLGVVLSVMKEDVMRLVEIIDEDESEW